MVMQLPRFILGAAAAALMLAPNARAAEAIYVLTYFEVGAASAKGAAGLLHQLRHGMRSENGVLTDFALIERGRPTRLFVLDAFPDKKAADAHAAALETQSFRSNIQPMLVAPPDSRAQIGFDTAIQTKPSGPRAVYVVTHVDVVPTSKPQTEPLLRSIAAAGRKMPGNLRFDVLDQESRLNHFTLFEVWSDHRAFEAYRSAAATVDFRQKLLPLAGALYDERVYEAAP
jgi:quinol monooxygenase YgiN